MHQATAIAAPGPGPESFTGLAPSQVTAIVPCHREPPAAPLLAEIAARVGSVLIVDDGIPASAGGPLDLPGAVELLRLPANGGKGHAVAAGIRTLLASPAAPDAVMVIDADGQHPPSAIPAFLAAAARAELVVGDRLGDVASMPVERRLSNRISTRLLSHFTGTALRDSQCGMRLLSGRALREVAYPDGGYEAETRHLKSCLRAGVTVAWVPIPAIYDGQASSFRIVRDTLRVAWALFA